jgi:hypothetical protein
MRFTQRYRAMPAIRRTVPRAAYAHSISRSTAMRADDAELPISDDLLRRLRESGL